MQPMANLDFLEIPLGKYIENHRKFGSSLKVPPKVFATNYFLKNDYGKYLNGILDKLVWVMWAELRVHNDVSAIKTPIGYIPQYKDLEELFKKYLNKNYSKEEYIEQFTLKIGNLIKKSDRVEAMYKKEANMPDFFWEILKEQRKKLNNLKSKQGEKISPMEILSKE